MSQTSLEPGNLCPAALFLVLVAFRGEGAVSQCIRAWTDPKSILARHEISGARLAYQVSESDPQVPTCRTAPLFVISIPCITPSAHSIPALPLWGVQPGARATSLLSLAFEVRNHMALHKLHASQNFAMLKTR